MAAKKSAAVSSASAAIAALSNQKASPVAPSISAKATVSSKVSAAAIAAIAKMSQKTGVQRPLGFRPNPIPAVATGSLAVDNLIGGNPAPDGTGPICPGYPRQHITEIYGAESSGKTTLALHAIVEVQKKGGVAMFLDFENAVHHGYAQAIGVDFSPEKLMLYQPDNMEQGLDMAAIGIKAGVDLIVIDSVAAMVTKDEMDKNFTDVARIGTRAAKLSDALPKLVKFLKAPPASNPEGTAFIFINQTRAQIGGMAKGDGTSGGKALKFFAYLRIQAAKIQSEYIERVNPVSKKKVRVPFGNKTQIKIIKSKVDAKQGQTAEIFIRFGQGVDDYNTTIESGAAHGIIKRSGASYSYKTHSIQGREKFRAFLKDNTELYLELQEQILKTIRSSGTIDPALSGDDDDDDAAVDALISSISGDSDGDEEPTESELVIDDSELTDD